MSQTSPCQNPQFSFVCKEKWQDLAPTEDDGTRYCAKCDANVFRTVTFDQQQVAAALGRCTAARERAETDNFTVGNSSYVPLAVWSTPPTTFEVQLPREIAVAPERWSQLHRDFPILAKGQASSLAANEPVRLGTFEGDELMLLRREFARRAPELVVLLDGVATELPPNLRHW